MTDPSAVTFVKSTAPASDQWFATAQDRLLVKSTTAEAFARFRVAIAAGRGLSSASLTVKGEAALTGTWTARSVDPATGSYQHLTWNTRPAAVAGSADRTATLSGMNATWDVTADVSAVLAALDDRVAFKLTSSSTTAQWLRTPSLDLTLVTYALAVTPTDVAPVGTVGTLKPVFTWTAPTEITKVQVQVSDAALSFTVPAWDSGELVQTVPRVDSATGTAWAGLSGTRSVRVRHFTTAAGWSPYATVSLTYSATTNFVVSNPGATDADATPPSVWTPPADAVRITSYLDGDKIDTVLVPGPVTSYTPKVGAKKSGQVLKRDYEFYDSVARTAPAFVARTTSTTWTPTATVAGLTTLTAVQDGTTPAVSTAWTRTAGTPDEVGIQHGDTLVAIVDGPAGTYRDWMVPPNTDLTYGGRAVVNRAQSNALTTQALRTVVTGIWVVDPVTERGFVLAGTDGLEIAMGGEVVVHTPIDGATLLRHTLTLRGPEGTITGQIDDWPGRTHAQQVADAKWLRERPERILRLVLGDLNVPVACSSLFVMFDREEFRTDRAEHTVSLAFSHAGGY